MSAPSIEVIDDETRLVALADDWNALLGETPEASAFQSLAWITACRSARPSNRRLFIVVVRDGADVVGILPTEIGIHGDLRFVGQGFSNYLGPIYRASHAGAVVEALAALLARDARVSLLDFGGLREPSPFLAALRRTTISGWSRPHAVETATCPFLDLTPGWETIYARRKGKQRSNFARKGKRLERLGEVEFQEIVEPDDVRAALPAMMDLYERRWADRRESGGFAGHHRAFHELAGPALAAARHARVSLLRVDGQIVAFSYGLRVGGVTTSYVLAHDDALGAYSPGLLLLLRLLEAACRRGDREYDFSIGEESYKDAWATGERTVFRVFCWRRGSTATIRGRARALGARAWVGARSIDLLRDLRREGLRRVVGSSRRNGLPDAPGLPAGTGRSWHVQRLVAPAPGSGVTTRPWAYREIVRRLSPRLRELAAERSFRGDALRAVFRGETLLGVAWRADGEQRSLVARGVALGDDDTVFYHPVAAGATPVELATALAEIAAPQAAVVVAHQQLPKTVAEQLASFVGDQRFSSAPGSLRLVEVGSRDS